MNRVAIVTDSTTAISKELAEAQKLTIVPLSINWDGKTYLENIDITAEEFYTRLSQSQTIPTREQAFF